MAPPSCDSGAFLFAPKYDYPRFLNIYMRENFTHSCWSYRIQMRQQFFIAVYMPNLFESLKS